MEPERETSRRNQDPGGAAIGQRRAAVFYGAQGLAFAVLTVGAYFALVLSQSLGFTYDPQRLNPLFLCWFGLQMLWGYSQRIAAHVCRLSGLSLEETTTETFFRNDELALQPLPDPEAFILNRGCISIVPVGTTLLCLIVGSAIFRRPHLFQHPSECLVLAVFFASLVATAILSWKNFRKPELQADRDGVMVCSASGVTSRQVAWPNIASCSIITERDVFGKVRNKSVQLNNRQQQKALAIQMASGNPEAQRENLDRFINWLSLRLTGAAYYPTATVEPFEPPPHPIVPKRETSDVPLVVEFEPECVKVKVAGYFRFLVSIAMVVASVIFLRWEENTEAPWERVIVEGVPILFFFATLITIPLLHLTAMRLRADAQGLFRRSGFFDDLQFTPWHGIAAAELVEKRDEIGRLTARHLVLEDRAKSVIDRINMTNFTKAQSARLLAFVRERIEGDRVDSEELPAF